MRRSSLLNIPIIFRLLGVLLLIEGGFLLTALPFSWFYGGPENLRPALFTGQHDFWPLLLSAIFIISLGLLIVLAIGRDVKKNITKRDGYVIVALAWITISIFGAMPFYLSGAIPVYTDAFFETISGFTTTGATILTDIESMPKGLLFWRSMTHWIGGMGIIVLSLAILPFLGIGGMQLFVAEVPGITYDKLHPRITQTAKRLWGIYFMLTFVQTLFLMAGGMDLFDGLCHSFATMATGGFSTKKDSIASFSPFIQYVIILFMILAGTNFALHYIALHGRLKDIWRNEEYRYYIFSIIIITLIITLALTLVSHGGNFFYSLRHALFSVVSIITTTGFITVDYLLWPAYLWILLLLLMFVGGSAGSTGGGVKVVRQLLLLKNSVMELKRLMHPQAVIPVRLNGKPVSQDIIFNVLAFFLIYMIVFAIGAFVMTLTGLDFESAVGASAACLGNIGPGIGSVGPVGSFAHISIFGKWFLGFLMLLGRLELFTILILLSPAFWKR
jgi:trk system potassium uptake protein